MERNADDTFGATGDQSTGGSGSYGSQGQGMAGGSTTPAGGAGGMDYTASSQTSSAGAGQTSTVDKVKSGAQDKLGQAKDKARELQSTLADRLDAGAEKLRQRGQSSSFAGATGEGSVGVTSDDRMAQVNDSVARGMQKSADWLRNGDLKADIEHQVRENPGRTLLIALGVGYLLGKAFRSER